MLRTAVVARRTDGGDPDTEEIRGLTEAAGAEVVGEVTQTRAAAPGTHLGSGKVAELAALVAETGADTVVVDAELTPRQTVALEDATGARVIDRHRVVLEIFARRARTRRATLQVELARLRYRLPRVRERADEGALNRVTESGTPYYDLQDRIDELERKLADCPAVDEQHREARLEQGFDLVALAGYTNAGKTTLLRRLADDLSLDESRHDDLADSAGVADRLFETLETTTRRATVDGRELLLTDTVGFLEDIPHWLVESFRGTLREVAAADAVVVVVDASEPVGDCRRKLSTTLGNIPEGAPVVVALNKADRLSAEELARRRAALTDVVDANEAVDAVTEPVPLSALEGDLGALESALLDALPALASARLELPLSDDAMSLLSRVHDRAIETTVSYGAERAVVEFSARPATVEKLRARAAALGEG